MTTTTEHDGRVTLESRICGECYHCPDGWHSDDEMPCTCTADCALTDDDDACPLDPDGLHFPGCGCDYTSPDDPTDERRQIPWDRLAEQGVTIWIVQ